MRVIITGRRYNVSTRMKSVIEQKLEKIKYFYDHILSFHVIIEKEKMGFRAEVAFSADGKQFFLQESAASINEAIDLVVDKLERQIRKHKDRLQKRKRPQRDAAGMTALPENIRFITIASEPRDLLEVIRELALSERDHACFLVKDDPVVAVALHKEESDFYTVIGRDGDSKRWVEKRIFLSGEEIERTDVLDYLPLECGLHDAIFQMEREGKTLLVFWNRDDNRMQVLALCGDDQFEIATLD